MIRNHSSRVSRTYPHFPIVGVGAIVTKDNKILLVKRAHEPGLGQWTLPGGVVELGESLEEAVQREVLEECGIKVEIKDFAGIVERVIRDEAGKIKYHYIIIDYKASYLKGELCAGSDVEEASWLSLDQIEDYPLTQGLKEFLKKLNL
jgi:mutator protein MutT